MLLAVLAAVDAVSVPKRTKQHNPNPSTLNKKLPVVLADSVEDDGRSFVKALLGDDEDEPNGPMASREAAKEHHGTRQPPLSRPLGT